MSTDIITTSMESVPNEETAEHLGLVRGNTVRARHVGSDIGATLKSLIGGEVKGYVEAMTQAREQAMERMIEQAQGLDADAIVNVRFTTSQVMPGAAEILVYGSAVRLS